MFRFQWFYRNDRQINNILHYYIKRTFLIDETSYTRRQQKIFSPNYDLIFALRFSRSSKYNNNVFYMHIELIYYGKDRIFQINYCY